MSTGDPSAAGPEPTEEELRAAYEAEIKKIRVEQVLLEHVVTLVNLGMRRTGLAPGTEGERDVDQVRYAIEGVRGLLPVVEQAAPAQARPIRDALSQLQMAYVRIGGGGAAAGAAAGEAAGAEAPGAERPGAAAGPPPPPPGAPGGPASGGPAGPAAGEGPGTPGEPGPAQRSGRLWVPGQ